MPTVLVLGATGYLGLPFAQSLLRSGSYTVYGLARSPEKGTFSVSRADHFPQRLTAQPSTYPTSKSKLW